MPQPPAWPDVAAALVSALDVDSPTMANDQHALAKASFNGARQLVLANGENPDSIDNYHGFTTFAGCSVAARDLVAQYR